MGRDTKIRLLCPLLMIYSDVGDGTDPWLSLLKTKTLHTSLAFMNLMAWWHDFLFHLLDHYIQQRDIKSMQCIYFVSVNIEMHLAHTDYGVMSSKVMMWLVTKCRRMLSYPRKALWGWQDSNYHINTEAYINILIYNFRFPKQLSNRVRSAAADLQMIAILMTVSTLKSWKNRTGEGKIKQPLSSWQFRKASVMLCLWKLSLGSCHTGERVPGAWVSNQDQTAQKAAENCVVAE